MGKRGLGALACSIAVAAILLSVLGHGWYVVERDDPTPERAGLGLLGARHCVGFAGAADCDTISYSELGQRLGGDDGLHAPLGFGLAFGFGLFTALAIAVAAGLTAFRRTYVAGLRPSRWVVLFGLVTVALAAWGVTTRPPMFQNGWGFPLLLGGALAGAIGCVLVEHRPAEARRRADLPASALPASAVPGPPRCERCGLPMAWDEATRQPRCRWCPPLHT